MADGFLGRWARRKEAVRQGKEVPPEPEPEQAAALVPPSPQPALLEGEGKGEGQLAEQPPPPTLEDVASLTPDSDFTRFTGSGVAPEVKNAAMKKLFSDPHFNVMDGLDTYIGDYNTPDPLPPEMLRQLASAKFLNLFDEEDKEEQDAKETQAANVPTGREVADAPPPDSVAQSSNRTAHALPPAEDHADPDLRLQQDDAPGPQGPGAGAG
jgi:hypothetical protein